MDEQKEVAESKRGLEARPEKKDVEKDELVRIIVDSVDRNLGDLRRLLR